MILSAVVLIGCSGNQIYIENRAAGAVFFLFRGEQREVPSGAAITVQDIPNGTYSYSTTYEIPAGVQTWTADEGLAGDLYFRRNQTNWTILYASVRTDTSYEINANLSTNDPVTPVGTD